MIVLASGSPRREELLKKICTDFVVDACEVEEMQIARSAKDLAVKNAALKAEIVAKKYFVEDVVIGADTIVTLKGEIFGKPEGKKGACEMLKTLSGKMHRVITGLAIVHEGRTFTDYDMTEVYFGEMSDQEIFDYVATGEPLDKSGSYALQGGAAKYIKKIHGDWSNVVGLPLYKLRMLLKSTGIFL